MGEKLKKAFEVAKEHAGTRGSLRLTIISGFSYFKADEMEDTDANIKKAEGALKEIIGRRIML